MELSLYTNRVRMQALARPHESYEFNNILDRLLINLYNRDARALDKAREECREKHIPAAYIDQIQGYLRDKPGVVKLALPDQHTRELYTYLKSRYPGVKPIELTKCVLRYAALGMGGQQWALNRDLMNEIRKQGVKVEAFASPFNNYFKCYYSIFKADKPFGSLGNFFDSTESVVYANPPFTPYVLDAMSRKVCALSKAVLITPTWTDAEWYQRLLSCGYTAQLKRDTEYTALGRDFTPKFTTTLWTKGLVVNLPAKSI